MDFQAVFQMFQRVERGVRRQAGRAIAGGAMLLAAATPAAAHAPVPGIEGFYVGLLDPLIGGPQVLLLATIGLLICGFAKRQLIGLLAGFAVACLLGIVFGTGLTETRGAVLGLAVLCGLLAAIVPGRFLPLVAVLSLIAGGVIGVVSIPDPGPLRDRIITVSGSFVGANVGLLYIVGGVITLREKLSVAGVNLSLRLLSASLAAWAAVLLATSGG